MGLLQNDRDSYINTSVMECKIFYFEGTFPTISYTKSAEVFTL